MMVGCAHNERKKDRKDRDGNQRYKCLLCGKRCSDPKTSDAAMMAGLIDHTWTFDELFEAVLRG